MKKYPVALKIVAVGIIILSISMTFISCIPIKTANASNDHHLITVTTNAYENTEDHTSTQLITQQQLQDIQQMFDELKNRLFSAESIEETQQVFNDTIVSLNKYNLLPIGITTEHAKQLVNQLNQNQELMPLLEKIPTKLQADATAGTIQNSCCFVAGSTSNTHFAKLAKRIAHHLIPIMESNTGNVLVEKIATDVWFVFNILSKITQPMLRQNGPHGGVCIYFGNYHYYPYPNWLSPAQGWISTIGINGKQNISGFFWGQKMTSGWQQQDDWYMNYTWKGCTGFTGLIIYVGSDSAYYLGSALQVQVGPNRP